MRLKRMTPLDWRKDWALHRAILARDSRGDDIRRWDMEHPDFTGTAGTASGVCWQVKTGEAALRAFGEGVTSGASFDLYLDALEIAPFDRCAFDGTVWEVRGVLPRSGFRHITLVEVGPV